MLYCLKPEIGARGWARSEREEGEIGVSGARGGRDRDKIAVAIKIVEECRVLEGTRVLVNLRMSVKCSEFFS